MGTIVRVKWDKTDRPLSQSQLPLVGVSLGRIEDVRPAPQVASA